MMRGFVPFEVRRACMIGDTLHGLYDHAASGPEKTAIGWICARYRQYDSTLFAACRTPSDVYAVLADGPRLLQEPWVGPKSVQHVRAILARALTLEET